MSVRTGRRALWRHERRGGVCSGPGCCVPLLLLCGAYVLRCVCEGLLFDRAASLQALHPNCNGVRGGSRDGHPRRIPHTTTRPFEAHHTSSACLCVVAVTRTTRWPSASGCSRHTLWINSGGTAALHRRACGSPAGTAGRLKPATDARITLVTTLCVGPAWTPRQTQSVVFHIACCSHRCLAAVLTIATARSAHVNYSSRSGCRGSNELTV